MHSIEIKLKVILIKILPCCNRYDHKNNSTITNLYDKLWDMIVLNIFPREKPPTTIGRPAIPFRKVLDGIVCILQTGYRWKMLPRDLVLVQPVVDDFLRWGSDRNFKNIWIRLLKEYDHN